MLRRLHNNIFAAKLAATLAEAPLVLVYQTLGQVDHAAVRARLQDGLSKRLGPEAAGGVALDVCHMKNTVAAATGDALLSRLFATSNLLVGFRPPPALLGAATAAAAAAGQQQAAAAEAGQGPLPPPLRVTRAMAPSAIVGGLLERPAPGPHLPQDTLRALVEAGVALAPPSGLGAAAAAAAAADGAPPLVLVGALYKRGATPLAHLKRWVKLDARQVYGELLGALDAPLEELLAFEGPADELLALVDDAAGGGVLGALDYKAMMLPPAADDAGGADAAAAATAAAAGRRGGEKAG